MAGELILIIDDNIDIVQFLADLLQPLDYRILSAPDGKNGLALAQTEPIDLILLDLNLPDITGLEILEALREQKCTAAVILMTLHGSENVAARALRMGVRDYLIKPFDLEELLYSIERALEEGRLRQERERLVAELAKTNQRLTMRMRELSTFQAVSRSLASLMPKDKLVTHIIDAAIYLTGADAGAIFLPDRTNRQLQLEALRQGKAYQTQWTELPRDGYAEAVMRTSRPFGLTTQPDRPCILSQLQPPVRLLLYVPIQLRNKPIGVLSVAYNRTDRPPAQELQSRITSLADYVAIALENARLHETLRETVATKVVRDTVVTLSHYVNNPLQVLWGVTETLRDEHNTELADMMELETRKIAAVISVLQDTVAPESILYTDDMQMLDIETEIQARLAAFKPKHPPEN